MTRRDFSRKVAAGVTCQFLSVRPVRGVSSDEAVWLGSTKIRYGDPGASIEQDKGTKSIPRNIIEPIVQLIQLHIALYAYIRSAQFLILQYPIARYDASVTDRWMSTIPESSSSCAASVASSSTPCPPQTLESPPGVQRPRHLMGRARANMRSRDTILPLETALPPATTPGACRRRAP